MGNEKSLSDEKQKMSMLYTSFAKSTQNKQNIIKIGIKTMGYIEPSKYNESFVINCSYSKQKKVTNIFKKIKQHLNKKYYPKKLNIYNIDGGFTGYVYSWDVESIGNKSITKYNKKDITIKGLRVYVKVEIYEHRVNGIGIECEYMIKAKSDNPLKCPIYHGMKEEYIFDEDGLKHLREKSHFVNEYESKPPCKYGEECKAYIREERGKGNDRLDDKSHIILYKHPPRKRNIKLSGNMHSLIINKSRDHWGRHPLYEPTNDDKKQYEWNEKDGFLRALISEIIQNGYKYDLCTECGENDDCKHSEYGLLKIVDSKMKDKRHILMDSPLNRGEMLAMIVYTGCDSNYNLCKTQREKDYKTWKWFDYCLYYAIRKLSVREKGDFCVYSGLNGVKMDVKSARGYFATYISTTWTKSVAKQFMGNDKGMIIEIDSKYKNNQYIECCDVSWISKFPDECEILFARSIGDSWDGRTSFYCVVQDDSNGVQTVSLK